MRKTKIICTMGPSTDKEGILEQLAIEGMMLQDLTFLMVPMRNRKAVLKG